MKKKASFIVFLGPDGSGKTTVINALTNRVKGHYSDVFIKHLKPDCFRTPKEHTIKSVSEPHADPLYNQVISYIKLLYFWFDYFFGYLTKTRNHINDGELVIYDRYYYDLLVDNKRYRYGGSKVIAQWVSYFIPKPQKIFILDAPTDVLQQRKQEVSYAETDKQRQRYIGLTNIFANTIVLDTSKDFDTLLNTIIKELNLDS